LSAAFDVDFAFQNQHQPPEIKIKGGGQECPPYTFMDDVVP